MKDSKAKPDYKNMSKEDFKVALAAASEVGQLKNEDRKATVVGIVRHTRVVLATTGLVSGASAPEA